MSATRHATDLGPAVPLALSSFDAAANTAKTMAGQLIGSVGADQGTLPPPGGSG